MLEVGTSQHICMEGSVCWNNRLDDTLSSINQLLHTAAPKKPQPLQLLKMMELTGFSSFQWSVVLDFIFYIFSKLLYLYNSTQVTKWGGTNNNIQQRQEYQHSFSIYVCMLLYIFCLRVFGIEWHAEMKAACTCQTSWMLLLWSMK